MIKHSQLYLSKQLFDIKSTNCLCIALNSIYVTNAPPNKTDKCSLVRFCFTTLNNRDLNESVKKTTRCVVFSG